MLCYVEIEKKERHFPSCIQSSSIAYWDRISYIIWRFFVVATLLIKAKQQHGKNQNKNTGLFINCMDFVVVPK
jgi:hypothetical protein